MSKVIGRDEMEGRLAYRPCDLAPSPCQSEGDEERPFEGDGRVVLGLCHDCKWGTKNPLWAPF